MKNRKAVFTATVLALALASGIMASPRPDGGPTYLSSAVRANANSEGENLPVITIHSIDNVVRGKTGSFVLDVKPSLMLGGTYVNFKVSGTAIAGVDYVLLVSPAYIGRSSYGVIQVKTLPNPRGPSFRQAYSVIVTLESGAGYAVGALSSATMWIKP